MKKKYIALFFILNFIFLAQAMDKEVIVQKKGFCSFGQTGYSLVLSCKTITDGLRKQKIILKNSLKKTGKNSSLLLAAHWMGYITGSFAIDKKLLSIAYLPIIGLHTVNHCWKKKSKDKEEFFPFDKVCIDYFDAAKKCQIDVRCYLLNIKKEKKKYFECGNKKNCFLKHENLEHEFKKVKKHEQELGRILAIEKKDRTLQNIDKFWLCDNVAKPFDLNALIKKKEIKLDL